MSFLHDVLLYDETESSQKRGEEILFTLGCRVRVVSTLAEAEARVADANVLIAEAPLPESLQAAVRAHEIPLCAVLSARLEAPGEVASEIGADAYIVRPYREETLQMALHAVLGARLWRERSRRAELALADVAGSERKRLLHVELFKALLSHEIRQAKRHQRPIAICVIALDGEECVTKANWIAVECEPIIRASVRGVDLPVRYGDNRFLVFLPHTDQTGAEVVGTRIANAIANHRFRRGDTAVTASVGISKPRSGQPLSFARLVRDAQAALRAAQLKGGGRVVVR